MFNRDRLIKVIDNSACLTRRQIDEYLQGKLYPEELYVVEMHLNECPFCNEAIDGYSNAIDANSLLSQIDNFQFEDVINEAPKSIIEKVEERSKKTDNLKKELPNQNKKKKDAINVRYNKSRNYTIPIGVAAGLALALGTWGYLKNNNSEVKEVILTTESKESDPEKTDSRTGSYKEDSIMNAKFGIKPEPKTENQEVAIAKNINSVSNNDSIASKIETKIAEPSQSEKDKIANAKAANKNATKAKEEENKTPFVNRYKIDAKSTEKATTATSQENTSSKELTRAEKRAKAKEEKKEKSEKEAKTITTDNKSNKKTEESSTKSNKENSKTIVQTQAEKDFNKGLELYNKKQYSASIMYFQSASKQKDFSKHKQAENYLKLAKQEVVNSNKK